MLPLPEVPKPTLAVELQANVAPLVGLLKAINAPDSPVQCVRLATSLVAGFGFTVTVKVRDGPAQPLAVAVTVTVATIGALVVLVAV